MLQILLDHLFRHLPYRGAEVPSRPKMPTPVSLLHVRKLFKQLARGSSFDSPHDLARCHRLRTTHQDMDMILANHPFHDPDLKGFTGLTHQLSHALRNLCIQHLVAIFRHPYKVVLNLKHRMATVPIFQVPRRYLWVLFSQIDSAARCLNRYSFLHVASNESCSGSLMDEPMNGPPSSPMSTVSNSLGGSLAQSGSS